MGGQSDEREASTQRRGGGDKMKLLAKSENDKLKTTERTQNGENDDTFLTLQCYLLY